MLAEEYSFKKVWSEIPLSLKSQSYMKKTEDICSWVFMKIYSHMSQTRWSSVTAAWWMNRVSDSPSFGIFNGASGPLWNHDGSKGWHLQVQIKIGRLEMVILQMKNSKSSWKNGQKAVFKRHFVNKVFGDTKLLGWLQNSWSSIIVKTFPGEQLNKSSS